jgi:hypothetical protein
MNAITPDPTAILLAGDIHGDFRHACYIVERAINQDVQAIVQLGDFGYWEHHPDGVTFLDGLSHVCVENEMPFLWLDGNHENHTMLRERYGPGGSRHKPTPEGFWEIRPMVYYIPRGTRWTWNGVRFLGLGGAYSVDKDHSLKKEAKSVAAHASKNEYRRAAGKPMKPLGDAHRRWWSEEEISDAEVAEIVKDTSPVDIMFTHDKPLRAQPRWKRRNFPQALPNQQRIQDVMNVVQPVMLFHGHLHFEYQDAIRVGDDDMWCEVHGINCNTEAQYPTVGAAVSWQRLSLERHAVETAA